MGCGQLLQILHQQLVSRSEHVGHSFYKHDDQSPLGAVRRLYSVLRSQQLYQLNRFHEACLILLRLHHREMGRKAQQQRQQQKQMGLPLSLRCCALRLLSSFARGQHEE